MYQHLSDEALNREYRRQQEVVARIVADCRGYLDGPTADRWCAVSDEWERRNNLAAVRDAA